MCDEKGGLTSDTKPTEPAPAAEGPRPARTDVAPPPAPAPAAPPSVTQFIQTLEYVDRRAPYIKLKRTVHWSLVDDASTGLGDHGEWTDLRPDQVTEVPLTESPEIDLWDGTPEEAANTRVPSTIVLGDGGIRARLGEVGVSRYEWERLDADARRLIKAYLQAEADLALVVVAAALIPSDDSTKEFQRKARLFLAQVTEDIERRSGTTSSPIRAIRRDRAWHEAQPLLARLTEVLTDIEHASQQHDLVNEPTWLAEQVNVVNEALTAFPNNQYYAYCTPKFLSEVKVKGARTLAREIAHYFHRDASVDDLRRGAPPRQRPRAPHPGGQEAE